LFAEIVNFEKGFIINDQDGWSVMKLDRLIHFFFKWIYFGKKSALKIIFFSHAGWQGILGGLIETALF